MIRARSSSDHGKEIRSLLSQLAVAIHERSSRTQQLDNLNEFTVVEESKQPGASQSSLLFHGQSASRATQNPTEVCIVYLREKIT